MADVRRALELGIEGIVLKDDAEGALAAVVAAVSAGQVSAPSGQRRAVRAHRYGRSPRPTHWKGAGTHTIELSPSSA